MSESRTTGPSSCGAHCECTARVPQSQSTDHTRALAARDGRRLEYLTLGWNIVEAGVAIGAGIAAGSASLLGFGIDSVIESASGAVLLWRLQQHEADEHREKLAHKLVGASFLLLAGYVAYDAGESLWNRETPEASVLGIAIAALSLIVMPLLARAKRAVARRLQSNALAADSRQTSLCAWLSAILLAGLGLNFALGWWWADSVAALVMVPIIAREGVDALQGKVCADCC